MPKNSEHSQPEAAASVPKAGNEIRQCFAIDGEQLCREGCDCVCHNGKTITDRVMAHAEPDFGKFLTLARDCRNPSTTLHQAAQMLKNIWPDDSIRFGESRVTGKQPKVNDSGHPDQPFMSAEEIDKIVRTISKGWRDYGTPTMGQCAKIARDAIESYLLAYKEREK